MTELKANKFKRAETVSKHPFNVAAGMSRLILRMYCMRLERTHSAMRDCCKF
jgi:hypothetical protein